MTAERIPPGASREIEGTLAPTPCAALTLMRDPVVTQCRQGDDDCRGAIVLNGGSD
ncbi:hypothetical protein [Pararhodospirillum photometricum]|uniref:Uncharacterized protein n=1 Tax=Pararhodospirillum photometricum DSM 122 TaxID=1150469 RepID=H6SSM2_PARPM|nr:hypothetical protein [Pararhodospirillum photometricum]CCG07901.1 unnamed protein product [Pararhodospirillum photometricum DSM 122]